MPFRDACRYVRPQRVTRIPAVLDIEHRIRRTTLREDLLVRPIFGDAPPAVYGGEK
jgi:hypothetical protein